jgi:hypothetical protein
VRVVVALRRRSASDRGVGLARARVASSQRSSAIGAPRRTSVAARRAAHRRADALGRAVERPTRSWPWLLGQRRVRRGRPGAEQAPRRLPRGATAGERRRAAGAVEDGSSPSDDGMPTSRPRVCAASADAGERLAAP